MPDRIRSLVTTVPVEAKELTGLSATVDDVIYMPSLQAPEDRPHPFVYFITISNQSSETVTIRGRKWIISQDDSREKTVVEGEGVVNQTPRLAPGDDFSYNSYHVVDRNSQATGAFFATTDEGRVVFAKIPDFEMQVPQWA
jgi:ApaG protein